MRELQPIEADPERALPALRTALSGDGPSLLPFALGTPPPSDLPSHVAKSVAVVIATSGTSGTPKRVALSTDALLASAAATDAALGGPGRWLLALPVHYIAGLQVLTRSIVSGTEPIVLPAGSFDPMAFTRTTEELGDVRRYTSLVPAQLSMLVAAAEADPAIATTLQSIHRMLIGGQRLDPGLRDRAERLGLRTVRTYGSSETAGGCVYDGVPLGQVKVRIDDAEVLLAGPMLAEEYLDDPDRTQRAFVTQGGLRWYRTGDVGSFDESDGGLLEVQGRRDDVFISGGEKVSLALVEAEVRALPGLEDAVVVAAPSDRWGQVPVVVLTDAAPLGELAVLRGRLTAGLGPAAAPDRIVRVPSIPTLSSGKPDRQALRQIVEGP